jgi:hypothetical protein
MKKSSTSSAVKEMQIKTLKFHLTSVRMAIIKKTDNNAGEVVGKKGTSRQCWWKCKLWKSLWRCLTN